MKLIIDVREAELISLCNDLVKFVPKFSKVLVESRMLPLGDVIISVGDSDRLLVERKSIADLNASIKDGRYAEQSYRLNGVADFHNHNTIYLIEGDITRFNSFKDRVDKQMIYSAMFSLNYYKGFSVMRSLSVSETATMLCNMVVKMNSEPQKQPYYLNGLPEPQSGVDVQVDVPVSTQYCDVIKKQKKENITKDNIGGIMLCQIPGVSSTISRVVLEKYKTIGNLVQALQADPACLVGLCLVDNATGKSRKISKSAIASIVEFLS